MIWIIALLCLGLVGLSGYYQGPIRAAFSLLGLFFGVLLATPLSPLALKIMPWIGLKHPAWRLFIPQVIAFLAVLIVFKIAGNVLHRKLNFFYKYKVDERKFFSWQRMYARVGFCVGLLNGAVYFFLLLMPIYIGGYFTTEASAGEGDPTSVKIINQLRSDLHSTKLDRVTAAYDPTPAQVYQASDIVSLVLHNPLLESRLSHYPVFLTLGERKEFQDLASDVQLQQMIQSQAKISDILNYPKIQAIVTNSDVTGEIYNLLGNDLNDLQEYLTTGKSPKYDSEKILGIWTIDARATVAQERKRTPGITPLQLTKLRAAITPMILGLSLTATTDNQMILKKEHPNTAESTVMTRGTWKKDGDTYQVSLADNKPDNTEIEIQDDKLLMPRDGHVLVFNKEM